jgi:pilus assembly protein CpaE
MAAVTQRGFGAMTVFTVGLAHEVAVQAAEAAAQVGMEFAGEYREHFSPFRPLQLPQTVRDSVGGVALIGCDENLDAALETAETLQKVTAPRMMSIAVSQNCDSDLVLRTMRAGCNEFLLSPLDATELCNVLKRFHDRQAQVNLAVERVGKVVSLFGAKGGVGTTTLAVHLAMSLVKRQGKRTLLIDHHHQLGHVCLHLGLKNNQYHFDELMRNVDRLDAELLQGFLVRHESGLDVLSSPDMCSARHMSTDDEIQRVLSFLRRRYEYILLDSSLGHDNVQTAIINPSDEVYLIATPDVAAVRDLSRHVENLSLSEATVRKLHIVVNRASSENAVSLEGIESAIRIPVGTSVPNNYAELLRSVNMGRAIALDRRSEFSMQINKWAGKLVGVEGIVTESAPKRKFSLFKAS